MMRFRQAWLPGGLLFVSFVIQLSGTPGIEWLQYRRDLILDGQAWRLLTGHLTHGTWNHWLLNAMGLTLLWALYPCRFGLPSTAWLMAGISLAMGMALLLLNPDVAWYLGMSALLHGLLVAWLVSDVLNRHLGSFLLLSLVGAKLAYEQTLGPLPGSVEATGLPVLVDAHLYAAIAGGVFGLILYWAGITPKGTPPGAAILLQRRSGGIRPWTSPGTADNIHDPPLLWFTPAD